MVIFHSYVKLPEGNWTAHLEILSWGSMLDKVMYQHTRLHCRSYFF